MTTIDNYCKYAARPGTAFLIGAAGTQVFTPQVADSTMNIFGVQVPVWAFSGLACAVSSVLGQVMTDTIAPHVTQLTLLSAPAHTGVNIALSVGTTALAYNTMAGKGWTDSVSLPGIVAIAASAEVGSGYLTESWIRPALNQYMN